MGGRPRNRQEPETRETDGQAGTTRAPGAGSAVSFASSKVRSINFKWVFFMAQRDGMGREEGGGFGMGNTCIPVADSF